MHPVQLLEQNLDLVARTIDRVCRRAHVFGADAEDFASTVRIALLENDGAILRGWQQRSSLATYLAVIVQRLLADEQIRTFGRWHSSAEARRHGDAGVMLERLIRREGRSLDAALPVVRGVDPSMSRERAEAIVAELPDRERRPRAVEIEQAEIVASGESADTRAMENDARRIADRTAGVVRSTLDSFSDEEQTLILLRFQSGMSVADIARMLGLMQRPLYRRLESLLERLREALTGAKVDASSLADVIGSAADLDLGLDRKTAGVRQTEESEARS
ncbi:MAG TPA: sigma-70 family RNA polymerase sigma factor [Thermoanaerobaculia bacterium]|jgi:RNA polymerase sigma factor (sigma-70 family)